MFHATSPCSMIIGNLTFTDASHMSSILRVTSASFLIGQIPQARYFELLLAGVVIIAALIRTVSLSDMFLEMAASSFRCHSHCFVISIVLLAYSSSIDVSTLATALHVWCRCGNLFIGATHSLVAYFGIMILSVYAWTLAWDVALGDLISWGCISVIGVFTELVTDLVLNHGAIRTVTHIVVRCIVLWSWVIMLELLHLHDRWLIGQMETPTRCHVIAILIDVGCDLSYHATIAVSASACWTHDSTARDLLLLLLVHMQIGFFLGEIVALLVQIQVMVDR